jgi:large subunit ribosomal protein L13
MNKKNKTYMTKKEEVKQNWKYLDANGQILGKLASEVATLLMGKHKPSYTPHINVGDKVVITNAEKIAVTGNKKTDKIYYRHTGFPGGIRQEKLGDLMDRKPAEVIRKAVRGMLPKNKLLKQRMKDLHIYAGSEHPHNGQVKKANKKN